jgi:hypothetical protein
MANGHKPLAASKTKQWWECAGCIPILERFPELQKASGLYAQLGTCAHALGEECLSTGKEPLEFMGRIIIIEEQVDGGEKAVILPKKAKTPSNPNVVWFEVDDDMVDAVSVLTGYVRMRCEELEIDPKTLVLEAKVNPLPSRDDTGGSADVRIDAWPDMLEVVDYKHGSGVFVPVEKNHQVRSYLVGVAEETGWAHSCYRGTIVQPRHPEAGAPMWEEYTAEELREFQAELKKKAERVDAARKRLKEGATMEDLFKEGFISVGNDGGSHCFFCELRARTASNGAVVVCPAVAAKAKEQLMVDFDDDPDGMEVHMPQDDEKLFQMVKWVPFMDKWAKEVKSQAEKRLAQRLQAGEDGYGYKFVEGRSIRVLKKMKESVLVSKVCKLFKLKKEELYTQPELLSGPQIEKLIKGAPNKAKFNAEFLDKPKGKPRMVPESAKGEPIIPPSAADDFQDDPEEDAI